MTRDTTQPLLAAYVGSDWDHRAWLRRPVRLGGYALATNGAAIVRVPLASAEDIDLPDCPLTNLGDFFDAAEENTSGNPFNLPSLPPPEICPACSGGKIWQCPLCQGDDSLLADCAVCKGEPDSTTEIKGWTFRDCWFCDGRGEKQQGIMIGPALFDRRLIAPLADLPGLVFCLDRASPENMAAFATFDTPFGQGQAVIMPMRQSKRTAVKEAA